MPSQSSYGSLSEDALLSLGSMEGLYQLPVVEAKVEERAPVRASPWPGYILAAAVTAAATAVHYLPLAPSQIATDAGVRRPISAAILAILGGVLVRNFFPLPAMALEGCKGVVKRIIPLTIVLTGAGLNLTLIAGVGLTALGITVTGILVAMGSALAIGRWLGLWPKTSLLIGAGTAICGTSAIVAVAPLVEARDEDVTLSVGTVSLLGLVLMFALPVAGGLAGLSDEAFGVWAGTSIHAVPQVVAAGFAYSEPAGSLATLVKLMRVTLLAPFLFVLMLVYARQRRSVTVHYSRFVPPFVWGFLALAVMNTANLIPALDFRPAAWLWDADVRIPLSTALVETGNLCLALSMAAMGLEVDLRSMTKVGGRAILAGALCSVALCAVSLALIRMLL
ncbi:MAG: YeiH family protein [Bryobacteraceae bacterium]